MLLLSPAFLAGILASLVAVYLLRCLLSPLAKVPGPRVSLFTSAVLKWNELNANRREYIHRLHVQYGPVVRIAPNEVSFTSPEAVKEIYCSGGSGYDKTEFYDLFQVYGRRTMFTTLGKTDHAKRRRILADRYANSNVMRPVPMSGIQDRARSFTKLCEESLGRSLDIFVTFGFGWVMGFQLTVAILGLHAYACDCVTHHLFHPYGTDCLKDRADAEMMHQVASDDSLQNRLIQFYSPTAHKFIGKALYWFAKPRETPLADEFVLNASKQTDPADFTLLKRMLEKSGLDSIDMAAECLDHMAAGIDTTGDALCFLMWEISQPRSFHIQKRLQQELQEKGGEPLDKLAYLEAVIWEGLRCFPAIPMSLPRYVPAGGRVLDGYTFPERTIVSAQAYSIHRLNDAIFPDAEKFEPERWLAPDGDAERKRIQFAFAAGGRGCVGKHLALLEMKTLLKEVYSRYTTAPDLLTTDVDMEMSDQLISSRPAGQRCLLRFERVQEASC
ncbi:hypothetical protein jhhlp_000880 [Lomentospora prolificans]|uniref:Cytochrome P450 n=1 Tax=Lomentospora prolificans TaxID=41688 RepID=A0A2N3NJZ3_9PEZI|nr:hypothetical protein jhhlp_000880 [Lomentospora prolificans]